MYITLCILIIAIILYVTNWTSYTTTSMLIMLSLYLTGIIDVDKIFANFINGSTLLVINMFVISGAILNSGAALKIGTFFSSKIVGEKRMMMLVTILAIIWSAVFSNMATAVLMTTLVLGICKSDSRYSVKKMLMPVAMGCMLGGMLTVLGTPGNAMVRSILIDAGFEELGFLSFSKIGLPVTLACLAFIYFIGSRLFSDDPDMKAPITSAEQTIDSSWNRNQIISISVFALVVIGMVFEKQLNMPLHIPAFIGVVLLLLTKTVSDKEVFEMINWNSTIMFVSFLTLGNAMTTSGAATIIANGFIKILGNTQNPIIICAVLYFIIVVLTQVMSNGGVAAVFFPIGLSIAQSLDFSPVAVLMIINVAAQASFATPLATPLNAYIMSVGNYKFTDFLKIGIPLIIITGIVSILLVPIMWPM